MLALEWVEVALLLRASQALCGGGAGWERATKRWQRARRPVTAAALCGGAALVGGAASAGDGLGALCAALALAEQALLGAWLATGLPVPVALRALGALLLLAAPAGAVLWTGDAWFWRALRAQAALESAALLALLVVAALARFLANQAVLEWLKPPQPERAVAAGAAWVDELEGSDGRLLMSMLPGRRRGRNVRDVDADLRELREAHGVDVVVTLVQRRELEGAGIADFSGRVRAAGMESVWRPTQDKWVPASRAWLSETVATVDASLRAGKTVLVHCHGGCGRTGLVVSALSVLGGGGGDGGRGGAAAAAAAIARVRRSRSGMVKNPLQIWFLLWWGRSRGLL